METRQIRKLLPPSIIPALARQSNIPVKGLLDSANIIEITVVRSNFRDSAEKLKKCEDKRI